MRPPRVVLLSLTESQILRLSAPGATTAREHLCLYPGIWYHELRRGARPGNVYGAKPLCVDNTEGG